MSRDWAVQLSLNITFVQAQAGLLKRKDFTVNLRDRGTSQLQKYSIEVGSGGQSTAAKSI